MVVTCPRSKCKTILSSACVFYEGQNLLYSGIKTNDSIEIIVQKIDKKLQENNTKLHGVNETALTKDVFQIAHGLSVGEAIKNVNGVWIKTQADIPENSGTIGVVSDVYDTNNFTYQSGGHLDIDGGWEEGKSYFLSTTTPGAIVLEEQYTTGNVREFIGTGTANGLLLEIDLGDIFDTTISSGGGGSNISLNTIADYRSSFESTDGKLYAGYHLNDEININRTLDGVLEKAINLTNLDTDWSNRLNLTYTQWQQQY